MPPRLTQKIIALITLINYLIGAISALCPEGSSAVFFIPHKLKLPVGSDSCFKDCAKNECTGNLNNYLDNYK